MLRSVAENLHSNFQNYTGFPNISQLLNFILLIYSMADCCFFFYIPADDLLREFGFKWLIILLSGRVYSNKTFCHLVYLHRFA